MFFSILHLPAALVLLGAVQAQPTVYLIRHGEKPASGNGLNTQGMQRAQCLKSVFGPSSQYNIAYILAETPHSNGKRARPVDTVTPLAQELGLTIDTSCDRDDGKCVKKAVNNYTGAGNILICWRKSYVRWSSRWTSADTSMK